MTTAPSIVALDFVITTDTMIAHLAGALGRPVWVLLHFLSSWLWAMEGERALWYPNMTLFRRGLDEGRDGPTERANRRLLAIVDGLRVVSARQKFAVCRMRRLSMRRRDDVADLVAFLGR